MKYNVFHESVQWRWDKIKLFLSESFWGNTNMLSNPFALDDRSLLPKGQSVFPSNGCLREDSYNMRWFCCHERHGVFLGTQKDSVTLWLCENLQSWSADWPVNVRQSNLGESGLIRRPTVCSVFCFQDAVLFAAVVPALHRALKRRSATLWCTLWWSWPQESLSITALFRSWRSLSWLISPCPMTAEVSCKRYPPSTTSAHLKNLHRWCGKSTSPCNPVCTTLKVLCVSLFQNNFLQAFPKAGASKATMAGGGGGGGGRSLLGLWLTLLVNLSFAEDGQQSILRVSGALELLADLAQQRHPALLVLHNLCFCSANKPHILTNGTGRLRGWLSLAPTFNAHQSSKATNENATPSEFSLSVCSLGS